MAKKSKSNENKTRKPGQKTVSSKKGPRLPAKSNLVGPSVNEQLGTSARSGKTGATGIIRDTGHNGMMELKMEKAEAVKQIREQVVARARKGRLIYCEFCGAILTEATGHMHEVIPRGKGGEYSLDNSRFICSECHIGPDGEHGDRKWGGRNKSRPL